MVGVKGANAIDTSAASVTVNNWVLEIDPNLAVTVVDPTATAVANPLAPSVLLMVPIPASDEVHVTLDVRSCVELSVYVPTAVNCCSVARAIDGLTGVIAIETRLVVTLMVALAVTFPIFPEIITLPADTGVNTPSLIVATLDL